MAGGINEASAINQSGQVLAPLFPTPPRQLHPQRLSKSVTRSLCNLFRRVGRNAHCRRDIDRLETHAHQGKGDLIPFGKAMQGTRHERGKLTQLGNDIRAGFVGLLFSELFGVVALRSLALRDSHPPGDHPEPRAKAGRLSQLRKPPPGDDEDFLGQIGNILRRMHPSAAEDAVDSAPALSIELVERRAVTIAGGFNQRDKCRFITRPDDHS